MHLVRAAYRLGRQHGSPTWNAERSAGMMPLPAPTLLSVLDALDLLLRDPLQGDGKHGQGLSFGLLSLT